MKAGCAFFCQVSLHRQFINGHRLFWDCILDALVCFGLCAGQLLVHSFNLAQGWVLQCGKSRARVARELCGTEEKSPVIHPLLRAHMATWNFPLTPCEVRKTQSNGWEVDSILCVGTAGPSALWVAQPTTLCTTDEGLAATPSASHCPAAPSILSGKDAVLEMCQ